MTVVCVIIPHRKASICITQKNNVEIRIHSSKFNKKVHSLRNSKVSHFYEVRQSWACATDHTEWDQRNWKRYRKTTFNSQIRTLETDYSKRSLVKCFGDNRSGLLVLCWRMHWKTTPCWLQCLIKDKWWMLHMLIVYLNKQ